MQVYSKTPVQLVKYVIIPETFVNKNIELIN